MLNKCSTDEIMCAVFEDLTAVFLDLASPWILSDVGTIFSIRIFGK